MHFKSYIYIHFGNLEQRSPLLCPSSQGIPVLILLKKAKWKGRNYGNKTEGRANRFYLNLFATASQPSVKKAAPLKCQDQQSLVLLAWVIAWGRVKLLINFRVFSILSKIAQVRKMENASEINP